MDIYIILLNHFIHAKYCFFLFSCHLAAVSRLGPAGVFRMQQIDLILIPHDVAIFVR